MTSQITLNESQKLYVIPSGAGYTTFGFENAQRHTMHILASVVAQDLGQHRSIVDAMAAHPLNFTEDDFGKISGYEKYRSACALWANNLSQQTYFDPGTDPKVKRLLEQYRRSGSPVRLFFGDHETGRDWMSEFEVLGRIGRSTGTMKVPLLVAEGDRYGAAILTRNVLRIIDAASLKQVYVHDLYQAPALSVHPDTTTPGYAFRVDRDGEIQARFRSLEEAHGYVAFMLGSAVYVRSLH